MNKTDAIKEVLRISLNRYKAEVNADPRNLFGMDMDQFRKSTAAAREFLRDLATKNEAPTAFGEFHAELHRPAEKRCGTCARGPFLVDCTVDESCGSWNGFVCWKAKP